MAYAFGMLFDRDTEKSIRSIWLDLQKAHLPSIMIEHDSIPHITLAIYEDLKVDKARKWLEEFGSEHKQFALQLSFVGVFVGAENVIFAAPIMNDALNEMHRALHTRFGPISKEASPYYLPDQWQPHCTLTLGMPEEQYDDSLRVIRESFTPMEATITAIGLAEFPPTRMLKVYELKP